MSAIKIETFPPGFIGEYGGDTAPDGWLLCFGQEISRTTFAALFQAIGTIHGAGDGISTFNIPDIRGRVVAGKDNMGGTSANRLVTNVNGAILGAAGGSESQNLITAQLPAHAHTVNAHSHNVPAHQHYTGGGHAHYTQAPGYSAVSYVASNVQGSSYNILVTPQSVGSNTNAVGSGWSDAGYGACTTDNQIPGTNNIGSGAVHNNVQPVAVLNKIIHI